MGRSTYGGRMKYINEIREATRFLSSMLWSVTTPNEVKKLYLDNHPLDECVNNIAKIIRRGESV